MAGPGAAGPAFSHYPSFLPENYTVMETATKPLKRNPNLVPLSREHHYGLLFCWKLKQGLANGTPPEILRKYTLHFWENILRDHCEKEDFALENILPDNDPLLKQFSHEHDLIHNLMAMIEAEEKPAYLLFEAIRTLVSDHIRFEERKFFPHVEKEATLTKLEKIGLVLLEEQELPDENFEPEFWTYKK